MDKYELFSRVGEFFLSDRLLQNNPDAVMALMGKMIVVRCEHDFARQGFLYTAYSELFEKTVQGLVIPRYDIVIEDGQIKVVDADA